MSNSIRIREIVDSDLETVVDIIKNIVVNEFDIQLKFDSFDSDLLELKEHYSKDNGGCFWVAEKVGNNTNNQIIGTVAIILIIK